MKAKVSAPSPCSAARTMVSRREAATQSGGCGRWRGFGTTFRGGICTQRPSMPVKGSSVMQRITASRPSLHWSCFSARGMPKPPSSIVVVDSPEPNSTRPPETRSSVASRSAERAGWL